MKILYLVNVDIDKLLSSVVNEFPCPRRSIAKT